MKHTFFLVRLCVALFLSVAAEKSFGLATFFWDTNGATPGAGTTPNGTWDVDAFWTVRDAFGGNAAPAEDGSSTTQARYLDSDAGSVVFSAGQDATSAYTVQISRKVVARNLTFQEGTVTIDGGILQLDIDNEYARLSYLAVHTNAIAILNSTIVRTNSTNNQIALYKMGRGKVVLKKEMTYVTTNGLPGIIYAEGGTIELGAANIFPDTLELAFRNGGNDNEGGKNPVGESPATFHTGGFNETLGPVRVEAVGASIDFGNGASALVFADSDSQDWGTNNLTLRNYTPGSDSLRIGTDGTGFQNQLKLIRFAHFPISNNFAPAVIDSTGLITPNSAAPVITSPPQSSNATAGRPYTFSVIASNNPTAYNWQKLVDNVWQNIQGATNATFTLNRVQPEDQGYYRVVVSNTSGQTISPESLLTVVVAPAGEIRILSQRFNDNGVSIRFTASPFYYYRLLYKHELTDPDWLGEGGEVYLRDSESELFYSLDFSDEDTREHGYFQVQRIEE